MQVEKLKTIDADTLLSTPMRKTLFVVDGLIPQGLSVLSGSSKIGKSWLMLWLGIQVARGQPVWEFETHKSDVLYLCLEDTYARIQSRLYQITDEAPPELRIATTSFQIGNGLEQQIEQYLSDFPKTKLVIIDTFQKVRDSKSTGGKSGMYAGDYYNNNGKRRVKYFSTGLPEKGNKRKAEAELARIRSEFVPPQEVGELASDMPFADYLLEWLDIVKVRVKATTFSSYEQMVKSVIEPYFRKKAVTLQGLEARHIQQFYSEKLKTVKPNSVIHYHAVIHQALKYAMKTDLVTQNVAMKVDRPKKNDYQPVFLDAEELQHLFEVVKGTKLELPVLVAAFYGLRRGEVCGLKWDAIDFERGTITIRHTVTSLQVDGKTKMYAQDSAKTKSSMRTLPLVGSFAEYFKEVKAAQEVNKKVCGNCYNYEYDGYVFVDELGDLMRPEYLTSYFPQYIQKHGCKRMRFHDLRHSCASLLLANGVPLKQIQEWLGHSDFSTTANIYAHLDYTSKLSSAKAMVSGMALPESVNFSSKWTEISNDGGKN